MIRFAFTPSTIRRSFDALFRDKTSGSQNGKRASYNFVKMGIAFGVILAILFGVNFVAASLKRSNWQNSAKRRAGARQTLKIGRAKYGFVWIPAGEFDMGSPESEENRVEIEKLHHVKLTKGFWTLETETTQALYQEVMGTNPSDSQGDDLPVETVSWDDATKFCAELTKRLPAGLTATLPTEAQWEYACRAGTKTAYWHGDSPALVQRETTTAAMKPQMKPGMIS
jgi:formylglycine-generating enzyme required for sulfatase activity